jgi:RNA polymerase sigma-70 factor (ECF subfamily)
MSNASNPTEPDLVGAEEISGTEELSGVQPTSMGFSRLVAEHINFVWRMLRRTGVPPGDLDDATQQVFLVANEKLSSIRAGRERSFLLGVASRVASHARRSAQRREAARQRFSESTHETPPDPEHLTQRREARELLDRVLQGMPAAVRTVFVLVELEELTVDEATELLELPRGTVATRLRRARALFSEGAKLLRDDRAGTRR